MENKTLADALLEEMRRVRDQIMPGYIVLEHSNDADVRRGVAPALTMMRAELDAAARALAEHDCIACLRLYDSLKGFTS